jgi:hypothetical protein
MPLTHGDELQKFLMLVPKEGKWSHLHHYFCCPFAHAGCKVGWTESCFGHADAVKIHVTSGF